MRKSISALCATAAIASMTFVSCNSQPEKTPADKLLDIINRGIEQKVIMFGHQDDTAYGHTWKYEEGRSDVLETAGDYPAVMGWDLGRIEFDDSVNLDGVPFDFMRAEIQKQHARGGINTLSWHAYTPEGKDSWMKELGVVTTILPGGANYDAFQKYLERAANFLLSLKDENGELIPVIFRPWHEHIGNWFWWGENRCTHAEYVALWDMTFEYMNAKGLNNLVWAYMPYRKLEEKMPSAEKYDMYGLDTYQHADDPTKYIQETKDGIAYMKTLSEQYNKPIALTETGYEGVKTLNWWTEILNEIIKDEPISYVLVWRNAWDKPEHFYGSYAGHESEADFVKFAEKPEIIFADEVKGIN